MTRKITASRALPSARTWQELDRAQRAAIKAWAQAQQSEPAPPEQLTRELRLDLNRRAEARRREQEAVAARAEKRSAAGVLSAEPAPLRAVLAHRNAWLCDTVRSHLEARGIEVVGSFEDGAEAAGTVVAEQPDLVLVEDLLPTLSGTEVIRRVRSFSPETVVGAQCLDSSGIAALADAGARAVFTRRTPPADIAAQLVECLASAVQPAPAD